MEDERAGRFFKAVVHQPAGEPDKEHLQDHDFPPEQGGLAHQESPPEPVERLHVEYAGGEYQAQKRQRREETKVNDVPPRAAKPPVQPAPAAEEKRQFGLPVVLGIGVVIALLVFLAVFFLTFSGGDSGEPVAGDGPTAAASAVNPRDEGSLNQQSTSIEPGSERGITFAQTDT